MVKGKHGGARKGAGRKPKAEEQKVVKLGTDAIIRIYGSVESYYDHIAKESKDSFPHLKLLHEYVFGKAPDVVHNINENYNTELTTERIKQINDNWIELAIDFFKF